MQFVRVAREDQRLDHGLERGQLGGQVAIWLEDVRPGLGDRVVHAGDAERRPQCSNERRRRDLARVVLAFEGLVEEQVEDGVLSRPRPAERGNLPAGAAVVEEGQHVAQVEDEAWHWVRIGCVPSEAFVGRSNDMIKSLIWDA